MFMKAKDAASFAGLAVVGAAALLLKRQITGNKKDREDLREAADSLVWSALERPEKNRR
jgi:hypothetical protein